MLRLLVVEDIPQYRRRIEQHFTEVLSGYEVECAVARDEALAALVATPPDLLLLDLVLPVSASVRTRDWRHGDQVLTAARSLAVPPFVIVVTTEGHLAREFLKLREVDDFFVKDLPAAWRDEELPCQVARTIGHLASRSEAMRSLRRDLASVGPRDLVVLHGPAGSGKGHVARVLHRNSPARREEFREVHLLHGAIEGVATGGTTLVRGIEHACELTVRDAALLEAHLSAPSASVILASDLPARELLARLAVLPRLAALLASARSLRVPPLAERLEDLAELAEVLRRDEARDLALAVTGLTPDAHAALATAVREGVFRGEARGLRSLLRESVAVAGEGAIGPEHLCLELPSVCRLLTCRAGEVVSRRAAAWELEREVRHGGWQAVLECEADDAGPRVARVRADGEDRPVEDPRLGRLLYLLAARPGEVVQLEERRREAGLLEREEVRRYIYRLRRLLDGGVDGDSTRFIRGHRGEGYEMRGDVDWLLVEPLPPAAS